MIVIKNTYNLTLKENTIVAKKLIYDIIYCGIKLKGSKLIFPES